MIEASHTSEDASSSAKDSFLSVTALLGFGPPIPAGSSPDLALEWAGLCFRTAAAGEDVASNVVRGLRTLLSALPRGDLGKASGSLLGEVDAAVCAAIPVLLQKLPRGVSDFSSCMGMASAAWILRALRDPPKGELTGAWSAYFAERLDYVALLADELDAAVRRQRINDGGDLVQRTLQLQRAEAATADGAASH